MTRDRIEQVWDLHNDGIDAFFICMTGLMVIITAPVWIPILLLGLLARGVTYVRHRQ